MSTSHLRPLTRLRLVLAPTSGAGASAHQPAHPPAEALAARVADALAVHGVQVRQQVAGTAPDGAPRADVALWLPDAEGRAVAPDGRLAPARVHAALVPAPAVDAAHAKTLARYDALVVPYAGLRDVVRDGQRRSSAREVPVVVARLPGAPLSARESEKALRGVAGRRVVLVDVRGSESSSGAGSGFDDVERLVVQLALKSHDGAVVLLAPHDERARARVRSLCERHAVDAWLASGPDAFALSIAACDLYVGRPSWDELALAALHRVAVAALAGEDAREQRTLADVLRTSGGSARVVDDVGSTLQLAATLDRRLADPGSLDSRGLALREALFGADRELLDALAGLEPLPHGALAASSWEPVGPHAADAPGAGSAARDAAHVDARDPAVPAPGSSPSRAQRIEDELSALKQRMGG